ncbi:MAG: phosphoribosyl 1,2-cyclic phosphodiesterase [Candidatus Azotimanducaceae bacterium]|jgi:phosphoribosyl 1,2-cyclic phosphodiesterase
MRFASLGSGSKGNSTIIDDGETCILIDLGFTLKETERRLRRLDVLPESIDAILVTHEHADHIHGVAPFARKYKTPVYLTPATYDQKKMGVLPDLQAVNCHKNFLIGSFEIEPVAVPHDAREPCQYIVTSGLHRVGVLTDLGHISAHVRSRYAICHALLLECNHDLGMLDQGPYPYTLKKRVAGDHGHLNNHQAAELLNTVELDQLQHLVISHISEKNNSPDLAHIAVGPVLKDWGGKLHLAQQDLGFDWLEVSVPA